MFKFVVKQIMFWLYDKKVEMIDEMINLLLKYCEVLKEGYEVGVFVLVEEMCLVDGMVKYFFCILVYNFIEVVYIFDEDWVIFCVFL